MIAITPNKLKTNGQLITEEVYLLLRPTTLGRTGTGFFKISYSYTAYLKSLFLTNNFNAKTVSIDNLQNGKLELVPTNEIVGTNPTMNDFANYLNLKYIGTLKSDLGLLDADITIISI